MPQTGGVHTEPGPVRATALELASGKPFGAQPTPPLPCVGPDVSPRTALDDALRPWLATGRCFTGFSGGRDSSAVLAVATDLARREGLPLPVPVTIRFPGVTDADESAWQELVIDHLGVDDWVRIDVEDELDYLGPLATRLLRRHGLMWPPYFHYEHVLLEQASGGVLLSGHDGDGVFGWWRWAGLSSVLHRKRPPRLGDMATLALAALPARLRRWEARERRSPSLPWLRARPGVTVQLGLATEMAGQPKRWDRWLSWLSRRRTLALGIATIERLARDCGTRAVHPFLDPRFLAALALDGGCTGYGERTDVMRALFADVLPGEVLARKAKSSLGGGFWRGPSQAFAASWDGHGVDMDVVDPVALREAWSVSRPPIGAIALLQGAWLVGAEGRSGTGKARRNEPICEV
ncbi:MAG: asparagine synthase C-terminal domain-containing protein [Actinobacteria bacterium]|nr:asparagine synthase C-terminal domain-containing protein [Actinomycetota bacterium]